MPPAEHELRVELCRTIVAYDDEIAQLREDLEESQQEVSICHRRCLLAKVNTCNYSLARQDSEVSGCVKEKCSEAQSSVELIEVSRARTRGAGQLPLQAEMCDAFERYMQLTEEKRRTEEYESSGCQAEIQQLLVRTQNTLKLTKARVGWQMHWVPCTRGLM